MAEEGARHGRRGDGRRGEGRYWWTNRSGMLLALLTFYLRTTGASDLRSLKRCCSQTTMLISVQPTHSIKCELSAEP